MSSNSQVTENWQHSKADHSVMSNSTQYYKIIFRTAMFVAEEELALENSQLSYTTLKNKESNLDAMTK